MLGEHFTEDLGDTCIQVDFLTHLVEAMYCASKLVQLPDDCLRLLEDNLDHSNETVRGYSFQNPQDCIREYDDYATSGTFVDWCSQVLGNLKQNVDVEIDKSKDYLDLLEIIASVSYLDVDVFKKQDQRHMEAGTFSVEHI